jgi:PAS domain-containing protein
MISDILLFAAAVVVLGELLQLNRQRRLLLLDGQRREFFVEYMRGPIRVASAAQLSRQGIPAAPSVTGERLARRTAAAAAREGIVYLDSQGRCAFADQVARDLLNWGDGERALRDVFAGGSAESTVLLDALARQGLIEPHATALAGPQAAPVEIRAVALRDRDDNLWGAALFIRPPAGDSQS